MKGLILKDLINLSKYTKTVLLVMLFFVVMGSLNSNTGFLSGVIIIYLSMLSVTSFSYDYTAKWDTYALSMPVTRKNIVISKYILSLLLALTGFIVSTAAGFCVCAVKRTEIIVTEQILTPYIILIIGIAAICILLPLIYKFGVEKSRIMAIVVFALPTFLVLFLSRMNIPMPSEAQLMLLLQLSPVIAAVLIVVSLNISYRIYMKKDI